MENNDFEIGLCMAGAVSAGAYTAGAVDYLLEVLDEWEKRRGEEGVPTHRVTIKTIGGASAGGMTGIITASALNNPMPPVKALDPDNLLQNHPENKLYHTWVDLLQEEMFPVLLSTSDIKDNKIDSLFNSEFITELSERALKVNANDWIERPYVPKDIQFFTTMTNLEGFHFNTHFIGNQKANDDNEYWLAQHQDYGAFRLSDSEEPSADGWIPANFRTGHNVKIVQEAAMATGAFPVGLKSRQITRNPEDVNDLEWNQPVTDQEKVKANDGKNYKALIVDGGVINNEPFERTKTLLRKVSQDHKEFESTVLMIDPFPSEAPAKFDPDKSDLFSIIGKTLSAMLSQMRVKMEVTQEAQAEDNYSQFLLSPKRKVENKWVEGARAISCGFLGGFGGFINKEFRIHDYFLGRANCERFLRHHFTVPADTTNKIFKEGYQDVPEGQNGNLGDKLQIIPLFDKEKDHMYMPIFSGGSNWPVQSPKDVLKYKKPIRKRASKIIMSLGKLKWWQRSLLWIGNRVLLSRAISSLVINTIYNDMVDYKLVKGPKR